MIVCYPYVQQGLNQAVVATSSCSNKINTLFVCAIKVNSIYSLLNKKNINRTSLKSWLWHSNVSTFAKMVLKSV